jgi:zinc/manganese transport system substrate-binding protein
MNRQRRFLGLQVLATAMTASMPVSAQSQATLRVVASFSILADIVQNVGGADVHVVALVGPNADAHVFEPTPAHARRLAAADLVFMQGLGFEGWLERLVRAAGFKGPVVLVTAGVTPRRVGKAPDPHTWQSLAHVRQGVVNIRDALAKARPARAAEFAQRAALYTQRIDALDAELRQTFGAMPAQQRRVITSHDAFGYFGDAYGIEFLAPQGMSTESQPSAAAVARLVQQVRRQRVRAVFAENISDPRLVERIAREGGAAVGGRLYSDALSAPGTEADTFLKLYAHNARAIAQALAAELPQPTFINAPVAPR